MGGRSSNANRNSGSNVRENTFRAPRVSDAIAVNINRVVDNVNASNEQTVFLGERNRRTNSLLNTDDKKEVVSAVKAELKKRGVNASVTITTPKVGPNLYVQYLNIRRKEG